MVCSECRAAGLLNEKGLWMVENERLQAAEATFTQAEALHDECQGCDCQHHTRQRLH